MQESPWYNDQTYVDVMNEGVPLAPTSDALFMVGY